MKKITSSFLIKFLFIFGVIGITSCVASTRINTSGNISQSTSNQTKNISYTPDTVTKYLNCTKQYEVKGIPDKDKFFSKMDCNPQLDQIHFWESQKYFKNFDSVSVKIAVIDGYFNTNHPDLKGSIYKTYSLSDPTCYPYDSKKTECSNVLPPANVQVKSDNINALNHGTVISGVIAGRGTVGQGITGINPSAQLILISQGNKSDNSDEGYIKTLRVAIDMKPDIISISWPLGKAPGDSASADLKKRFEDLLKEAVSKGILVTFAAGNESLNVDVKEIYPTRFSTIDGVISVGARDYGFSAAYSNYGTKYIGITAPGLVMSSAGKTSNNSLYMLSAGTSYAGPLVAGAASRIIQVLKSKNIPYTPLDIENILYSASDLTTNLKDKFAIIHFLNMSSIADAVSKLEQKSSSISTNPANGVTPTSPSKSPSLSERIQQKISTQVLPYIDESGKGNQKAPGMVVGVITKDFTGTFGFGTTQIGTKQKPNGDTLYSIGSVTKVFTSLILASEVARGNLRLNQSAAFFVQGILRRVLPKSLTFGNLVTHTSGLENMPENTTASRASGRDGNIWWSPSRNYTRLDLVNCLKKGKCYPQSDKIGTYAYSNLGIAILGMALQDALGFSSFDEMLRSRITAPLNMKDTGMGTPDFLAKIDSRITPGYGINSGILTPTPYTNMGAMSPAGGIISTANDILKFLSVLTGINTDVFAQASQIMMQPILAIDDTKMVGYAVAIEGADTDSPTYLKTGATPGFSSFIIWKRNPQIGIVVLANRAGLDSTILPKIAKALIDDL